MHGFGWEMIMTAFCKASVLGFNQQHEFILAANRWALKRMKTSAEKSVSQAGGKALEIPMGNLVLLCDHPEGCNRFKIIIKMNCLS